MGSIVNLLRNTWESILRFFGKLAYASEMIWYTERFQSIIKYWPWILLVIIILCFVFWLIRHKRNN